MVRFAKRMYCTASLLRMTLPLSIIFLSSCSSTLPISEPRYTPKPIRKTNSTVVAKQFLPDGWADITSKSKQQQIKLWAVNRDYSATLVIKELYVDSVSQKKLLSEEMNVIATISLHSKVDEQNSTFRVTRVPVIIDTSRNFSSYVYSENGLLRRVVIMKKLNKLFEVELLQEQSSVEFESFTNDLLALVTKWYEK